MKLLKTSFFVLFFSLILNSANAQGWGVRAGVNFSTLSSSDADPQIGAYAGLYKQFGIVPKILFIQPEVQYSKQGFDTDAKNYDLHYIQVPIVAKLYFLKIISVETGPQFGFLVNDNIDDLDGFEVNTFDPAWNFGLNFNLPLGLSIGARYIASFNDLVDNSGSKNQVIQVGAGLKF
ncbi:MAG: porin family protein [Bacteroidota bacterium]